jgi:CheY-like chemotaxis protein
MKRILIVDDHHAFAQALVDHLSLTLCEYGDVASEIVHDGNGAVERVLSTQYDLILLDMKVCRDRNENEEADPELGLKLIRNLKGAYHALGTSTRLVVLTAHPSCRNCLLCARAGIDDYWIKSEAEVICRDDRGMSPDDIVQGCRRLLFPDAGSTVIDEWFRANYGDLLKRFGPGYILIVPEDVARRASSNDDDVDHRRLLEADAINGFVVVCSHKYEYVRDIALRNVVLRWAELRIVQLAGPGGLEYA